MADDHTESITSCRLKGLIQNISHQSSEFFAIRFDEFASEIKDNFDDLIEEVKSDIAFELTEDVEEACDDNITHAEAVRRKKYRARNG